MKWVLFKIAIEQIIYNGCFKDNMGGYHFLAFVIIVFGFGIACAGLFVHNGCLFVVGVVRGIVYGMGSALDYWTMRNNITRPWPSWRARVIAPPAYDRAV